jgi:7-cyano-7-deazaguanine synthase
LADDLGVLDTVYNKTLTCYNGVKGEGCGHCPACTLRRRGYEEFLKMKSQN